MKPGQVPPLDALFSFRGAVAAALCYGAVNGALTLAAGPALALDDVKLNVFAQSLAGGYSPGNPPLFEWTLYAVQRALGPTSASFVAVKTIFLVLTAAFAYLAAREAGGPRAGAAAALALPLIPQFGWGFHQTLTHSAALFAAVAFFWYALLRLQRRNGLLDLALLGAAVGLGIITKYSFLGAAAAGLAAAALHAPLRAALLTPKAAVAALSAAAISAPHLFWLASHGFGAAAPARDLTGANAGGAQGAVTGLLAVTWSVFSFLAPAFFFAAVARGRGPGGLIDGGRSVLSDATAISIVCLATAAMAFGWSEFPERYAIAFLYPAYLYLALAAVRPGARAAALARISAASLAVAAVFVCVRAAEVLRPGAPFCSSCRQYIPYAYIEAALAAKSAQRATLVAFDDHTAGNLRRLFGQARVLSSHQPDYAPPPAAAPDECYFIWSTDLAPPPPAEVVSMLDAGGVSRAGGPWLRRMAGDAAPRHTTWTIAAVDKGHPLRASLCRD